MNELRKNDKVKEYIDLCNQLNFSSNIDIPIPTDEELAYKAFNDIAIKTNNPCNVYLFLGMKTDENHSYLGSSYKLTIDERKIYKNLDTGFIFYNYSVKKDLFHANNEIINCFGMNPEEEFDKKRKKYFLNLLQCNQEEAIQKTLKLK